MAAEQKLEHAENQLQMVQKIRSELGRLRDSLPRKSDFAPMVDKEAELATLSKLAGQGKLTKADIQDHLGLIGIALEHANSVGDLNKPMQFIVVQMLSSLTTILNYYDAEENRKVIDVVQEELKLFSSQYLEVLRTTQGEIQESFDRLQRGAAESLDGKGALEALSWSRVETFVTLLQELHLKVDRFKTLINAAQEQLNHLRDQAQIAQRNAERQIEEGKASDEAGKTKVIVGAILVPFTFGFSGFLIADGVRQREEAQATIDMSAKQIEDCGSALTNIGELQLELDQFKAKAVEYSELIETWAKKLDAQLGIAIEAIQREIESRRAVVEAEKKVAASKNRIAMLEAKLAAAGLA